MHEDLPKEIHIHQRDTETIQYSNLVRDPFRRRNPNRERSKTDIETKYQGKDHVEYGITTKRYKRIINIIRPNPELNLKEELSLNAIMKICIQFMDT